MKIRTRIELTEKELLEIISERFNLKDSTINVYKYDGDNREPSYVNVIVEGVNKQK